MARASARPGPLRLVVVPLVGLALLGLALLGLALLGLALTGCGGARETPTAPQSPTPSTPASYASALEEEVNAARRSLDLPPLVHDECAATAALARAAALVGAPELGHAPLQDVIAACARGTRAAENLSRSERSPREVVDAWLASPGHAANIRDPTLTRGAIACVQDGEARGEPRFLCSHVLLSES